MISFKQFFTEALRTRPEAASLLRSMHQRLQDSSVLLDRNQMISPIPRSPYHERDLSFRGEKISEKHFNTAGSIENVPTHKITAYQKYIDRSVATKKIYGKTDGGHTPEIPLIVRFQHKGETHHLLLDGNHRVVKNVVQGIPMTKARVLDVDHNSIFMNHDDENH